LYVEIVITENFYTEPEISLITKMDRLEQNRHKFTLS